MDPFLWSALPQEVVELVFARLPVAKTIELCDHPTAWSAMSKSSAFGRVLSECHRKLFGLVREEKAGDLFCNLVYDIKSNEWIYRELGGFNWGDISVYQRPLFTYGGLVCLVPDSNWFSKSNWLSYPIFVGNPLTNEWKALPPIPQDATRRVRGVQLVMEEDTKCYRVMLMRIKTHDDYDAQCFDSKTGVWSCMESGLIYVDCFRVFWNGGPVCLDSPCVYDCATKARDLLIQCPAVVGVDYTHSVLAKDRLFVLHKWSPGSHLAERFKVSEYAWQSSASNSSSLSIIGSNLSGDSEGYLLACSRFVLLVADDGEEGENHQYLIELYQSSANVWHSLSMGDNPGITEDEVHRVFICIEMGCRSLSRFPEAVQSEVRRACEASVVWTYCGQNRLQFSNGFPEKVGFCETFIP